MYYNAIASSTFLLSDAGKILSTNYYHRFMLKIEFSCYYQMHLMGVSGGILNGRKIYPKLRHFQIRSFRCRTLKLIECIRIKDRIQKLRIKDRIQKLRIKDRMQKLRIKDRIQKDPTKLRLKVLFIFLFF